MTAAPSLRVGCEYEQFPLLVFPGIARGQGLELISQALGTRGAGLLGLISSSFLPLQVNVMAVSICTREAYQSMKERNIDDGHIININR